jgi:hypothetical protein
MKKINAFIIFFLVAVFSFVCKVDLAFSQNPFSGQLYLYISHVYSNYYDENIFDHYFVVDASYPKSIDNVTIEDLIVTTNEGDIIFPPDKLKDPNAPVVLGVIKAPMNVEQFGIIKAVANINGTFYDITEQITPSRQTPHRMVKLTDENGTCPPKMLDFFVGEGIFDSFVCGDYCHTGVIVNGKLEDFLHESSLAYFFEDEKNSGKKIKFNVEVRQSIMYDDETLTKFECATNDIISNIVVLSK